MPTPTPAKELNPRLPLALENILAKALEKDPDLRCQTAAELRADLKRIKRDLDSEPRAPSADKSASGSRRRADAAAPKQRNPSRCCISKIRAARKKTNTFATASPKTSSPSFPKSRSSQIFPRSEMLAFRDKPVTAQQVGQQLGAAYVLEGSIRRAGNRVRITAQLVEASTRHSVVGRPLRPCKWKTFSRFRKKSRAASRKPCALRLPRRKIKSSRASPPKILRPTISICAARNYARRAGFRIRAADVRAGHRTRPEFRAGARGHRAPLRRDLRSSRPESQLDASAASLRATAPPPSLRTCLKCSVARARIFYAQKKNDETALLALRAIERKPDCDGAWNILGRAYFASGRYEEAAAARRARHGVQRRRLQYVYPVRTIPGTSRPEKRSGSDPRAHDESPAPAVGTGARRRARTHFARYQPRALRTRSGRKHPPPADRSRPSPRRFQHALQCRLHLRRAWEKKPKRSIR